MSKKTAPGKTEYFFFDIDLRTRQIVGWGSEPKDKVEVHLTDGYHRMFVSRGQYNKLEKKLLDARSQ